MNKCTCPKCQHELTPVMGLEANYLRCHHCRKNFLDFNDRIIPYAKGSSPDGVFKTNAQSA